MPLEIDLPPELTPAVVSSTGWRYRDYQVECFAAVEAGWQKFSRQMIVKATGLGKTITFAAEAKKFVERGRRVLILADTEELTGQAADKLRLSTGLIADIEKAEQRASLSSWVVVASVQTLSRVDRLMGFPDDHFGLVIADECDLSMAPTWQRVLRYFCFGRDSLVENWELPKPSEYVPTKAKILGVTATPYLPSLGTFYQHIAFKYRLREAVRDGWLVRPVVRQLPGVRPDISKIKVSRTSAGSDLDIKEIIERLKPFLRDMCTNLVTEAGPRKTLVFVPSVEIARTCADIVRSLGYMADFVSGACPDRTQKISRYARGVPQFLFNALLLKRGFDDAGIQAVSLWRPTKILSFYEQCLGRCTRVLPGVIDNCAGREERLAAIAASKKPHFLIIDPLWISERMDLTKPVDLVTSEPEVREKMIRDNKPDLIESEAEASLELLLSLEREARKHAGKEARTVDPLGFADRIGAPELRQYEPMEPWEFMPPTDEQIKHLRGWGFDVDQITNRGLATKLIDAKRSRDKLGLATPSQMEFLASVGYQNVHRIEKERAKKLTFEHRADRHEYSKKSP